MTGERRHRLVLAFAWLLTPLVAWAASFFGGWVGAAIGGTSPEAGVGLVWMGGGAVIGGVGGAVAWILGLSRWRSKTRRPGAAGPTDEPR